MKQKIFKTLYGMKAASLNSLTILMAIFVIFISILVVDLRPLFDYQDLQARQVEVRLTYKKALQSFINQRQYLVEDDILRQRYQLKLKNYQANPSISKIMLSLVKWVDAARLHLMSIKPLNSTANDNDVELMLSGSYSALFEWLSGINQQDKIYDLKQLRMQLLKPASSDQMGLYVVMEVYHV